MVGGEERGDIFLPILLTLSDDAREPWLNTIDKAICLILSNVFYSKYSHLILFLLYVKLVKVLNVCDIFAHISRYQCTNNINVCNHFCVIGGIIFFISSEFY